MVKEAAKRLLDKKAITADEFEVLNKYAEELEKNAASLNPLIRNASLAALGLGAVSGAAFTGEEIYKKLMQRHAIKKSFEQLTEKVPALQEYPQDKVKDYFEVVKSFSPRSAANPLVAGALVHKMLEFGGVDHKLIQDITNIGYDAPSGFLYDVAKNIPAHLQKQSLQDNDTPNIQMGFLNDLQ